MKRKTMIALVRGEATPRDLGRALKELGIERGEHFLLVHPSALDPVQLELVPVADPVNTPGDALTAG